MKFQDYKYERVDIAALQKQGADIQKQLSEATSYEAFKKAFEESQKMLAYAMTMATISQIRFTIDTKDEFYAGEKAFWDENGPLLSEIDNGVTQIVMTSPFKEDLKKDVPETFFLQAENQLKTFTPEIIADLQEENSLSSEYDKLIGGAEIEFRGETHTLATLGAFKEDPDEEIRKAANIAYWAYIEEHEKALDELYDKLIKVRDKIAKKLGFDSFTEVGYLRMNRFGYGAEDVANYRRQVLEHVVPVATKAYEHQKKRLGVDKLDVYNVDFKFKSGNPTPKHDKDTMVQIAKDMYKDLSPATEEFFNFMVDKGLLDLEAKPGKAPGGYCTFIPDYESPFIFSNFNGTSGDVDVLTHEAGHAFQVYCSRHIRPLQCIFSSSDGAEIHSMSMEFFAWPWMEQFFGEDADKYYYTHLASAIQFLPYGVLVDHFQHEIYANVNMTFEERKATWKRLAGMYLPHLAYDSVPFLDKGTWWFRQIHVFKYPFYYIDYTLAQVVALQFWSRLQDGDQKAFDDYHAICKAGGSLTFKEIVKLAKLNSPFEDGCLTAVMKNVDAYLENSSIKSEGI